MTTVTRKTYTRHGSSTSKARQALADALASELELPAASVPFLERAGKGDQADAYSAAAERVLDELADRCALEITTLARERDRLVRDAYEREQDELATAPRIAHLRREAVA